MSATLSGSGVLLSAEATERSFKGIAGAWCNVNQTGTQAIRQSLNISSINDDGAGATTFNYTNSFANSEYARVGAAQESSAGGTPNRVFIPARQPVLVGSSQWVSNNLSTAADSEYGMVNFYGDLA